MDSLLSHSVSQKHSSSLISFMYTVLLSVIGMSTYYGNIGIMVMGLEDITCLVR